MVASWLQPGAVEEGAAVGPRLAGASGQCVVERGWPRAQSDGVGGDGGLWWRLWESRVCRLLGVRLVCAADVCKAEMRVGVVGGMLTHYAPAQRNSY